VFVDLADVEDITSKTGNFKKFVVFVRMLQSAVLQQSDSVFIDLLTYQDLEILKAKKQSNATAAGAQQQLPASTKRYLILTYASEFDRVHYPLPLLQEDPPDSQRLIAVIHQLRQQLLQLQQKQQQDGALPLSKKSHTAGAAKAQQQLDNGGSLALPGPLDSQVHLPVSLSNVLMHVCACNRFGPESSELAQPTLISCAGHVVVASWTGEAGHAAMRRQQQQSSCHSTLPCLSCTGVTQGAAAPATASDAVP
jgi:hypothetical protein